MVHNLEDKYALDHAAQSWERLAARQERDAADLFGSVHLLTTQPSENHWSRLWIGLVWCPRFRGPDDSYRIHFRRRNDGADCLAGGGGFSRGRA